MIGKFITEVKTRGIARTNRYRVIIPFTSSTIGNVRPIADPTVKELVTIFCDSVTLPGMNLSTTAQRITGEAREFPYERTFDTCQISFFVDTDFYVRSAFESWMHSIIDQKTRNVAYYDSYVQNIRIEVDNLETLHPEYGDPNVLKGDLPSVPPYYVLTLHEAFPKTIQAVTLDVGSKELMKLNVTLQYKYWTSSKSDAVGIDTHVFVEAGPSLEQQNAQVGPRQNTPRETENRLSNQLEAWERSQRTGRWT